MEKKEELKIKKNLREKLEDILEEDQPDLEPEVSALIEQKKMLGLNEVDLPVYAVKFQGEMPQKLTIIEYHIIIYNLQISTLEKKRKPLVEKISYMKQFIKLTKQEFAQAKSKADREILKARDERNDLRELLLAKVKAKAKYEKYAERWGKNDPRVSDFKREYEEAQREFEIADNKFSVSGKVPDEVEIMWFPSFEDFEVQNPKVPVRNIDEIINPVIRDMIMIEKDDLEPIEDRLEENREFLAKWVSIQNLTRDDLK